MLCACLPRRGGIQTPGQADGLAYNNNQKSLHGKTAGAGKAFDIPEEDWDKYLEQTPASPEDRLVLEQCLKALDDSERQIVILHAVGGMKHRETAELLGLPLATVLSKYSRAIKKLKSKLEKREGI